MKACLISFIIACCTWPSFGQGVFPQVVNAAGFDWSGSNFYTTISIGEPAVITLEDGAVITQGFLQPARYNPCDKIQVIFFPNPAVADIVVDAQGCEAKIESLEFYNSWGQLMTVMKRPPDNKINLGNLSPSLYYVKVILSRGDPQVIKIIKVSN